MSRRADCPSWCTEHVPGPSGMRHLVTLGDVRLTRVESAGAQRTVCSVRRPGRDRNLAEVARLCGELVTAGRLLRRERPRRRVSFTGNWAVPIPAELTSSAAVG